MNIPTLTITQEGLWASLVAIGAKPFETRPMAPPSDLIGRRVAIHAGKRPVDLEMVRWIHDELVDDGVTRRRLQESGLIERVRGLFEVRHSQDALAAIPLGKVLATAVLSGGYQVDNPVWDGDRAIARVRKRAPGSVPLEEIECDPFGYYEAEEDARRPGLMRYRWAWWLTDIEELPEPVPARGMQGFWPWEPPSQLQAHLNTSRAELAAHQDRHQ